MTKSDAQKARIREQKAMSKSESGQPKSAPAQSNPPPSELPPGDPKRKANEEAEADSSQVTLPKKARKGSGMPRNTARAGVPRRNLASLAQQLTQALLAARQGRKQIKPNAERFIALENEMQTVRTDLRDLKTDMTTLLRRFYWGCSGRVCLRTLKQGPLLIPVPGSFGCHGKIWPDTV
jgi:hypothetical protein